MKLLTFRTDNHTIELHNSLWGKETVIVDGKIVSSKYSIFGHTHRFPIGINGQEVKYSIKFRSGFPAAFDIYKSDDLVLEFPRNQFWRIGFFTLIIIFAWELVQGRIFSF